MVQAKVFGCWGLGAAMLLSACAGPVKVVGWCETYQKKDFRDPALRKQSLANQKADRNNEVNRVKFCEGKRQ